MTEAARAWAAGGLIDQSAQEESEAVADARRFGLPEVEISALAAQLGGSASVVRVWPQNAGAVDAFLVSGSQWRTTIEFESGRILTRYIGLDYAGVQVALDARGIEKTPALWAGLVAMEMAARDALNDARGM